MLITQNSDNFKTIFIRTKLSFNVERRRIKQKFWIMQFCALELQLKSLFEDIQKKGREFSLHWLICPQGKVGEIFCEPHKDFLNIFHVSPFYLAKSEDRDKREGYTN